MDLEVCRSETIFPRRCSNLVHVDQVVQAPKSVLLPDAPQCK